MFEKWPTADAGTKKQIIGVKQQDQRRSPLLKGRPQCAITIITWLHQVAENTLFDGVGKYAAKANRLALGCWRTVFSRIPPPKLRGSERWTNSCPHCQKKSSDVAELSA